MRAKYAVGPEEVDELRLRWTPIRLNQHLRGSVVYRVPATTHVETC